MLGYTYANDNPVSGSDPTGLINVDDGNGGGGYTDDDVDKEYCPGCPNTNPNPNGPNGGYGDGGGNDDGGTNHPKKKKRWYDRVADNVVNVVDHAQEWAKEHASVVGMVAGLAVGVVAGVAFCAATAGVGCVVIAGAIAGALSAGTTYGTRVALDDAETFSISGLAKEVAVGVAWGAAGGAVGKAVGAGGKVLLGKIGQAGGACVDRSLPASRRWLQMSDRVDVDDLFESADGQPVHVDGVGIYRSYLIEIGDRSSTVNLTVSAVEDEPVQGICLQIDSGQIEVNGEAGPGMVLWMDTAPRNLVLSVSGAEGSKLRVWNCWRGKFGQRDAWFGNAAMMIDSGDRGRYAFKCSHGQGELDFANLVFDLKISS